MGTCLTSNAPREINTLVPIGFLNPFLNIQPPPKQYILIKTAQFDYHGGIPTIHVFVESTPTYKTYYPHPFRSTWQHDHESHAQSNNGAELTTVTQHSQEWNDIVNYMANPSYTVLKIQRVENPQLWNKYMTYYESLGSIRKEVRVWHGTRTTQPSLIYNGGFKKECAKVGGCLWYAFQSSYSMGSFAHNCGDGTLQVFLCLVAGGNTSDVKYIWNGEALNVFVNDATYPAYLITYR